MKDPRDIILLPVISEKSYDLIEAHNTYTFIVDRRARKEEIREAVEALFEVPVLKVNTLNRKGKRKRTRFVVGKRPDTKRAMVTLPRGHTVGIFGV
ncbi:MAG: 50S ribosomal protein L23 [bacterium]|nr:50S ribosomal protein L23 [bacterium]MDE0289914.1 50S ribosomal protein L23 [bacterium]MDE0439035.1 50S ribosomal protein L23 [bacterium]